VVDARRFVTVSLAVQVLTQVHVTQLPTAGHGGVTQVSFHDFAGDGADFVGEASSVAFSEFMDIGGFSFHQVSVCEKAASSGRRVVILSHTAIS